MSKLLVFAIAILIGAQSAWAKTSAQGPLACPLQNGPIQHVVFLIFDNVHFLRDNANVPSDLQQMPNLLNFIRDNGTLLTNDHTVLISHTANGILTNLTGMYSDRHGQSVANSYRFFKNDGSGATSSSSSFKYWNDFTDGGNPATSPPTASADTNFNMVTGDSGSPKNTPAPWVPYTRAGCDFGAAAGANIVLENNNAVIFAAGPTTLAADANAGALNIKVASTSGFKAGMTITVDAGADAESATIAAGGVGTSGAAGTGLTLTTMLTKTHLWQNVAGRSGVTVYGPFATDPTGDMTRVFGDNSAEWNEGKTSQLANPGSALRNLAQTDFVGFAIHCTQGPASICAGNAQARTDSLPDEPGTYIGYLGLFGAKSVNPAINGGNPAVNNLDTPSKPITDQFLQPGFPGFDGLFATTTLAYVAQMLEAGIPVVYGYISDAHDQHGIAGEIHATRGPGEADYVQQLANYNAAFGAFFARLAAHGIDRSNTLFVITVEEGDHFVGSPPTNPGCDGVTMPCVYPLTAAGDRLIGEVNANLAGLLATLPVPVMTPFTVHSDMAPTIYITGNPSRTSATARTFGRAVANLTAVNPYPFRQGAVDQLTAAIVDPVGMDMLHMVTADPLRTPTLTMFGHPDYFLFASSANCNLPCVFIGATPPNNNFAWNHGGIQHEIGTIWLGIVGPGVLNNVQDDATWADHTDVRPTILSLVGLQDSYVHDGRVLTEVISEDAQPVRLRGHTHTLPPLAALYKQINAPFGQLGQDTLTISTFALKSGNAADDTVYINLSNKLLAWTAQRNAIARQMRTMLDGAAFGSSQGFDEPRGRQLIGQAQALLAAVSACAADPALCAQ
jgi:hypothetical protein